MVKRDEVGIVLSYGLFLTWLQSFLYNGSMLNFIFNKVNIDVLAMVYIAVPAIASFLLAHFKIKEKHNRKLILNSLLIVVSGTVILMWIEAYLNVIIIYFLAGILGLASVIYIIGWGVCFIRKIPLDQMFRVMAAVICLSRILMMINRIFEFRGFYHLSNAYILLLLLISSIASYSLLNGETLDRRYYTIMIDKKIVSMLCAVVFLLNIGGGVSQTFFERQSHLQFPELPFVILMLYSIAMFSIIRFSKKFENLNYLVNIISLLGIGFLFYIIFYQNAPIALTLTLLAYLFLDVMLWTIVAKLSYMSNEPYKVFFPVMGSNLLAVLFGNILYMQFSSNIVVAIGICVVFIIIAFSLTLFMIKSLEIYFKRFNERNKMLLSPFEIFTEKEKEIVSLMLLDLKNREIAEKSGITENTLKTHAKNIYAKAEVANKKELIKKYK
jgi:DNA-binding CsgD family transcriptional regulator